MSKIFPTHEEQIQKQQDLEKLENDLVNKHLEAVNNYDFDEADRINRNLKSIREGEKTKDAVYGLIALVIICVIFFWLATIL